MPLDLKELNRRIVKSGQTQTQISAATGIPQGNISRLLHRGTYDLELVERVCRAIKCPIQKVIRWDAPKAPRRKTDK